MRIESYFQRIREILDACPFVQSSELTFVQRSSHEGFIRGNLYFRDGSLLHLREFIDVETSVERLTYVFQYMDRTGKLVFRYDNTRHHAIETRRLIPITNMRGKKPGLWPPPPKT